MHWAGFRLVVNPWLTYPDRRMREKCLHNAAHLCLILGCYLPDDPFRRYIHIIISESSRICRPEDIPL